MTTRQIRRKTLNLFPEILIPLVPILHLLLAPYTKVEESFTLHAVHDYLSYGLKTAEARAKWDHIEFPGAVPRSFLGPLALGLLSWPVSSFGVWTGLITIKLGVQFTIRSTLLFLYWTALAHLSKSLRRRYGATIRNWFLLISSTQFHTNFYASRTLPNFLALPGVILAISLLIRSSSPTLPQKIVKKRRRNAVVILTVLATNIRLELALFLLPTVLGMVLFRRISLKDAVVSGMIGGFGSLTISAPLDHLLWSPTIPHKSLPTFTSTSQILWPELSAFSYNLLEGQASNWGVSVWHYYLTNSLPKLLLGGGGLVVLGFAAVVLILVGVIGRGDGNGKGSKGKWEEGVKIWREVWGLFGLGVVSLVGGLSFVGHKEWRFIIYVVPIFNILAAITASSLWNFPQRRLRSLFRLGLVGILLANVVVSSALTYLSIDNYPGGEVWKILDEIEGPPRGSGRNISIHYSSYPLQTGASLFTFLHTPAPYSQKGGFQPFPSSQSTRGTWLHSKAEDPRLLTPHGARDAGFTYLVVESGEADKYLEAQPLGKEGQEGEDDEEGEGIWEVRGEVSGYQGIRRKGKFGVEIVRGKKIVILGRT